MEKTNNVIRKPNNVVRIPASLNGNFFKYWFEFLEPIHRLTPREIDVIATFVKNRYELSKVIKDQEILDKVVMNEDTKNKVQQECNISHAHLMVILASLKKHKVIVDGKINPRYLPNIKEDEDGNFQLLLYFDLK